MTLGASAEYLEAFFNWHIVVDRALRDKPLVAGRYAGSFQNTINSFAAAVGATVVIDPRARRIQFRPVPVKRSSRADKEEANEKRDAVDARSCVVLRDDASDRSMFYHGFMLQRQPPELSRGQLHLFQPMHRQEDRMQLRLR